MQQQSARQTSRKNIFKSILSFFTGFFKTKVLLPLHILSFLDLLVATLPFVFHLDYWISAIAVGNMLGVMVSFRYFLWLEKKRESLRPDATRRTRRAERIRRYVAMRSWLLEDPMLKKQFLDAFVDDEEAKIAFGVVEKELTLEERVALLENQKKQPKASWVGGTTIMYNIVNSVSALPLVFGILGGVLLSVATWLLFFFHH